MPTQPEMPKNMKAVIIRLSGLPGTFNGAIPEKTEWEGTATWNGVKLIPQPPMPPGSLFVGDDDADWRLVEQN